MKDEEKSKEQLLTELRQLRQQITELEKSETERKRTEEELSKSEERFRLLFENSLDAVLLTAPNGQILKANPAACRTFGVPPKRNSFS